MQNVDLKKLRLLQGMTLEELANKLEISKQAVDSHEKGFSNDYGIRLSILMQHLNAMGVELRLTITLPSGEQMELKNPQK